MRSQAEFCLKLMGRPEPALAGRVFDFVWRVEFAASGFCLLDIDLDVDSHTLRSWMVELKDYLNDLCFERTGVKLRYRSMARFDQQETTKFHIDGGPDQSFLMLGYEPTRVRSRLFLADYTRAAFDLGITPREFLSDFNPMFAKGEELLGRYTTELPEPAHGQSRILLINNSSLPFTEDRTNPLGVMHKAIIVNPTSSVRRIVNSTMLVTEGDEVGAQEQEEFVATDKISQKTY